MKKQSALWCLLLLLTIVACTATSPRKETGEWAKVPGILKNIVPPAFADTIYDVTEYGAKDDTTRVRDKDCVKNRVKRAKIVRFTLC